MQNIQAGDISIQISHVIGFIMVILSSYGAFILKTIKKDHQKLNDEYKDFKKDCCIKIDDLYNSRHSISVELSRTIQHLNDLQKTCDECRSKK